MATTMTTPEKNSKKSGNKLLHRTVTICVILLLLLCVGLFFWHNKNATASDNRLEDSLHSLASSKARARQRFRKS